MQLYIARNGVISGPFTQGQIQAMLTSGAVTYLDLLWTQGMAEWLPIHTMIRPAALPPPLAPPPLPVQYRAPAPELRGIDGWLLVFCIQHAIFAPFGAVSAIVRSAIAIALADDAPPVQVAAVVDALVYVFLNLYAGVAGIRIWAGNPNGRNIANTYLVFRLVVALLDAFVVMAIMTSAPQSYFAAAIVNFFFIVSLEIAFFAIWKRYFSVSVRVRNTYG